MEPTRYFIKGYSYAAADPELQDALARVYGSPERPRCLCASGGVEMYIAKHADYVVKRMPDTGHQHHPTCPSFELDPGMSGLGELAGEAIIEHSPDLVEVRTDFAMSRMQGNAVQRGEAVDDPAEVRAPRRRMSLRALLHFLYDRAGFNRWYPAMEGRRNQGVLHKYLAEAAKGVLLKGVLLEERLYVPDPFRAELKHEIGERRRRKLAVLLSPEDQSLGASRAQLCRHPAGPRCRSAEKATRDDGRPGLREARSHLSGGYGEHDADHGPVDPPGRVV